MLKGARRNPEHEAFGGPIRARLEEPTCAPAVACPAGHRPRPRPRGRRRRVHVGVEPDGPAVGPRPGSAPLTRGSRPGGGDEEDWLSRLRAAGGRIRYLAEAGVDHRRAGRDARIGALARANYHRGRRASSGTPIRGPPRRSPGSSGRSPAASGTPAGGGAGTASCSRRSRPAGCGRRSRRRRTWSARSSLDWASGDSGRLSRRTWRSARPRRLATSPRSRRGSGSPRRAARPGPPRASPRGRAARTRGARGPHHAGAGALPPRGRGHGSSLRSRRRQVGNLNAALGAGVPGVTTGCSWSTTTRRFPGGSSTRSCCSPSGTAWSSRSPPTRSARTPPGR